VTVTNLPVHWCVLMACMLALPRLSSAYGAQALPLLSAGGTAWVDPAGNAVTLRGCNLGNWFVQEMWMHSMRTDGIPHQYTMEQVLTRRFGAATKDRLMETYRANYITARDFEIIKSFGMNVVRLPILYTLIEDDSHPFELRPNAWAQLDRAVNTAEAAGIYTILDLHGAPGGRLDATVDEISLTDDATGQQMVSNGEFGTDERWIRWRRAGELATDFAYTAAIPAELVNSP